MFYVCPPHCSPPTLGTQTLRDLCQSDLPPVLFFSSSFAHFGPSGISDLTQILRSEVKELQLSAACVRLNKAEKPRTCAKLSLVSVIFHRFSAVSDAYCFRPVIVVKLFNEKQLCVPNHPLLHGTLCHHLFLTSFMLPSNSPPHDQSLFSCSCFEKSFLLYLFYVLFSLFTSLKFSLHLGILSKI